MWNRERNVFWEHERTMLVLSRKVGQRILVGDDIAITVVKLTGGGVRLGIEAPQEMPVIREELAEKMAREKANSRKVPVDWRAADGHSTEFIPLNEECAVKSL
jgi:carbon storage regulator